MWEWGHTLLVVCGSGDIHCWLYVGVGTCTAGRMWEWGHTLLVICGSGDIHCWSYVGVGTYTAGCMWERKTSSIFLEWGLCQEDTYSLSQILHGSTGVEGLHNNSTVEYRTWNRLGSQGWIGVYARWSMMGLCISVSAVVY